VVEEDHVPFRRPAYGISKRFEFSFNNIALRGLGIRFIGTISSQRDPSQYSTCASGSGDKYPRSNQTFITFKERQI
jgi:hypothetical protein